MCLETNRYNDKRERQRERERERERANAPLLTYLLSRSFFSRCKSQISESNTILRFGKIMIVNSNFGSI